MQSTNMQHEELNTKRLQVLEHMSELNKRSINCSGCQGYCCTFQNNSMQITETEAEQIIQDLNERNVDLQSVQRACLEAIDLFRLDKEILAGRTLLRKRYTCPFFKNSEYGCTLSAQKKPIGCLAFNPTDVTRKGEKCQTTFEGKFKEEKLEKLDIPRAVLKALGKNL